MDIGVSDLIIVLFVVILLFGPGRIVNIGRELREGIRQFKQGLEIPDESEKADENKPTDK